MASGLSAFIPPPPLIRGMVGNWAFLSHWTMLCLINTKKLAWTDVSSALAEELQSRNSVANLQPLQRMVDPSTWPTGIPPQPERRALIFSVAVSLGREGQLEFEPHWPRLLGKVGASSRIGLTKRQYEEYGSWNVLSVEIDDNGPRGLEVLRLLRQEKCIHLAGRRWCGVKVRQNNDGQELIYYCKQPAVLNGCQLPLAPSGLCQEDFQVNLNRVCASSSPLDSWHFDAFDNSEMILAKAVSRGSLAHSTVTFTIEDNLIENT